MPKKFYKVAFNRSAPAFQAFSWPHLERALLASVRGPLTILKPFAAPLFYLPLAERAAGKAYPGAPRIDIKQRSTRAHGSSLTCDVAPDLLNLRPTIPSAFCSRGAPNALLDQQPDGIATIFSELVQLGGFEPPTS